MVTHGLMSVLSLCCLYEVRTAVYSTDYCASTKYTLSTHRLQTNSFTPRQSRVRHAFNAALFARPRVESDLARPTGRSTLFAFPTKAWPVADARRLSNGMHDTIAS